MPCFIIMIFIIFLKKSPVPARVRGHHPRGGNLLPAGPVRRSQPSVRDVFAGLHQAGVPGESGRWAAAALRRPGPGDLHPLSAQGQPLPGAPEVLGRVRSVTGENFFLSWFINQGLKNLTSCVFPSFWLIVQRGSCPCASWPVCPSRSTSSGCAVCVSTAQWKMRSASTTSARCATVQ